LKNIFLKRHIGKYFLKKSQKTQHISWKKFIKNLRKILEKLFFWKKKIIWKNKHWKIEIKININLHFTSTLDFQSKILAVLLLAFWHLILCRSKISAIIFFICILVLDYLQKQNLELFFFRHLIPCISKILVILLFTFWYLIPYRSKILAIIFFICILVLDPYRSKILTVLFPTLDSLQEQNLGHHFLNLYFGTWFPTKAKSWPLFFPQFIPCRSKILVVLLFAFWHLIPCKSKILAIIFFICILVLDTLYKQNLDHSFFLTLDLLQKQNLGRFFYLLFGTWFPT